MSVTQSTSENSGVYDTSVAGSGLNGKGSWVQMHAGIPEDCKIVLLNLTQTIIGVGTAIKSLVDVGAGAAGSESVIVANVPIGAPNQVNANPVAIAIPVAIASGSRVACRAQSSLTNNGALVTMYFIGGTSTATTTTIGANTSTSAGTLIDPGTSANTRGSWTQVTSSLSVAINWLLLVMSGRGNTSPAWAIFEFDVGTGAAGSESVVIPNLRFDSSQTGTTFHPNSWSLPVGIAASTRVAVRASSTTTDATDRLFEIVGVGIVDAVIP